jgi:hypothetical protein
MKVERWKMHVECMGEKCIQISARNPEEANDKTEKYMIG